MRRWREILNVLQAAKDEVKHNGLRRETAEAFLKRVGANENDSRQRAEPIAQLYEFLRQETRSIPAEEVRLGSSDIIESIFGKYKNFSSRSTLKGLGKMILSIPAFTTEPTPETVKTAMVSVRFGEVTDWLRHTLGRSLFSKRKEALGRSQRKNMGEKGRQLLPKVAQI